MEFKLLKSCFKSLKIYSQKEACLKNGQAEELAIRHRLLTIGHKFFSELKKQTQNSKKKEILSTKHSIFSAWKHYAKQNSLVKKYLKECDYSSGGNYDSNLKSSIKSPIRGTFKTLSDEALSPVELKENKGLMSSNHPNVLANTISASYQFSKYY